MRAPPYIYASTLHRRQRAWRGRRRRVSPLELALAVTVGAGAVVGALAGHLVG